jgi:hypothetical protein
VTAGWSLDETQPLPLPPGGMHGIAEVAAGLNHVAMRTRSGGFLLWADRSTHGFSSTLGHLSSAHLDALADPKINVTAIASGLRTTVALTSSGEVLCTGSVVEDLIPEQTGGLCSPVMAGGFLSSSNAIALAGSGGGQQTALAIRAGPANVFFVQLNDTSAGAGSGTWVAFNTGTQRDTNLSWLQGHKGSGRKAEQVADLLALYDHKGRSVLLATLEGGGRTMVVRVEGEMPLDDLQRASLDGGSGGGVTHVCTVTNEGSEMGGPAHIAALLTNGSVVVHARPYDGGPQRRFLEAVSMVGGAGDAGASDSLQPPADLATNGSATSLACGVSHISVTLANGSLRAWGIEKREGILEPPVGGAMALQGTSAGLYHSAYLSRAGNVYQAGVVEGNAPNALPDPLLTPDGLATQVAAGGACALAQLQLDGGVVGWGSVIAGVAAVPPGLSSNPVVQLAAGLAHALALLADGTVVTWGYVQGKGAAALPPQVQQAPIAAIAASVGYSVAVTQDEARLLVWGNMLCGASRWGLDNARPAVVTGVAQVSAGAMTLVVLLTNGSVLVDECFPSFAPQLDAYDGNVSAVAASATAVLLLLKSGHVVVVGTGAGGITNVPEAIQGQVVRISAGTVHALALLRNGSLVSWGQDDSGQVGDMPPEVRHGRVTALSAGGTFSMAIVDPDSLQIAAPPGQGGAQK